MDERPVSKIVNAFKRAKSAVSAAVGRLFTLGFSRKNGDAAAKESAKILSELNEEAQKHVDEALTKAAKDGTRQVLISLGLGNAVSDVKLTRMNIAMLNAAKADTYADLLAVTQNMDRRTRMSIRQAIAEAMRANLGQGVNSSRTISSDALSRLRNTLGQAADTGIIDAAGRRWKPEVYVETVVLTKMAETQREATINEALGRDVYYAQISRHGAKDACRNWEGRIVKLTPDAPGDYPYVGDLPRREIFHPRCRHVLSPIRNPENIGGGI